MRTKNCHGPIAAAALALTLGIAGRAVADTPAVCGDVNESGTVTSGDALLVLKKGVGLNVQLQCLDNIDRYGSATDLHKNSIFDLNYLLGRPVTIAHPATVTAIGLIVREIKDVHVRMALYADKNGSPDTLVVATASTATVIGASEIPVTPTQVPAGNYWIVAVYDAPLTVAADEIATNAPEHEVKYRTLTYGNPMPSPMNATDSYNETEINYWVKVSQ